MVTNYTVDRVTILYGNGSNGILGQHDYPCVPAPIDVAVADLNGDPNRDIVVASATTADVSVLLGTGAGLFAPMTNYSVGAPQANIALADLNHDGARDLIACTPAAGAFTVLMGSGAGAFGAATPYVIDLFPQWAAVADLDGDGHPDVAEIHYDPNANYSTMGYRLGDGLGGFFPPGIQPLGLQPDQFVLSDVNRDGRADAVIVSGSPTPSAPANTVTVLFGLDSGGFAAPIPFVMGNGSLAVFLADLDGDGSPELITNNTSGATVSVCRGLGGGFFGAENAYITVAGPFAGVFGDFNGDGFLDMASAGSATNVGILLGDGQGNLAYPSIMPQAGSAEGIAAGDFNLDGFLDLAVSDVPNNLLVVIYGNGLGGAFGTSGFAVANKPAGIAAGDLDGDGLTDLVVGTQSGLVSVLRAVGVTFAPSVSYSATPGCFAVAIGDLSGDGFPEIVASGSPLTKFINSGTAQFGVFSTLATGFFPATDVAIADMTGDGFNDVVSANGVNVCVIPHFGAVPYGNRQLYALDPGYTGRIAIGDLNGDQRLDIVTALATNYVDILAQLPPVVPKGVLPYGAGTPGCAGHHHFAAVTAPGIGNPTFQLRCDAVPASSVGLVLVADVPDLGGSDSLFVGILLYVNVFSSGFLAGIDMPSTPLGIGNLSFGIPANPSLVGNTYYFQSVWYWGSACPLPPLGLSSSNGLSVTLFAP